MKHVGSALLYVVLLGLAQPAYCIELPWFGQRTFINTNGPATDFHIDWYGAYIVLGQDLTGAKTYSDSGATPPLRTDWALSPPIGPGGGMRITYAPGGIFGVGVFKAAYFTYPQPGADLTPLGDEVSSFADLGGGNYLASAMLTNTSSADVTLQDVKAYFVPRSHFTIDDFNSIAAIQSGVQMLNLPTLLLQPGSTALSVGPISGSTQYLLLTGQEANGSTFSFANATIVPAPSTVFLQFLGLLVLARFALKRNRRA